MIEEKKGDVQIYRIIGKLDSNTGPSIEEPILEKLTPTSNKILLDFEGVTYMSSAGIRVLYRLFNKTNEVSGKFIICNIKPSVMEIFQLTNLKSFINIANSEEEALKAFN